VEDGEGFKSFKDRGRQEVMPPLPVGNRWVRILRRFYLVN
jgi:hypothetical protein